MLLRATEYAIRALVFIQLRNWEEKRPGGGEIAKEIEAPEAFSAKILQTLSKHKLIESMKGRGGGFFFTNNQSKLTLHDVILVMEGDACFNKCGFGLKTCDSRNPCPLHDKYKVVNDLYCELVKTETIESLSKSILDGNAVLSDSVRL